MHGLKGLEKEGHGELKSDAQAIGSLIFWAGLMDSRVGVPEEYLAITRRFDSSHAVAFVTGQLQLDVKRALRKVAEEHLEKINARLVEVGRDPLDVLEE